MSTLRGPNCIHHLHPITLSSATLPALKRSALACNPIYGRCYHRGHRAHYVSNPVPPNAVVPPRPVTLSSLLSFGRPVTPESVLKSFAYVKRELPRRLAMRVRAFEALPFIVGTNPYISKTLERFRTSFEELNSYPPIKDVWENAQFVSRLERLVQSHANDIPTLAKGFQECARYMSTEQVTAFMDGVIRNRISLRLIAEHHIAITHDLKNPILDNSRVGVVNMACSPAQMIQMCGSYVADLCEATFGLSPKIVVNGYTNATFAYIPVHLEYILTEMLKNAFRATVESFYKRHGDSSEQIPPVIVTISPATVPDHSLRAFLSLRIRDQGGGISSSNMSNVFSYAFTTARNPNENWEEEDAKDSRASRQADGEINANETPMFVEISQKGLQVGMGTIAGLGYGLPMSRLYAEYFGGSLDLLTLDGWGSDVFVKLRCLDEAGGSEI